VLAGFLSAVGVSLIIGKLPWCARPGGVGHELARLVETVQNQGEVNTASALLAPGVMLVMVGTIKTPP
jgi:MFS superfamily sulfate permease-like transporter